MEDKRLEQKEALLALTEYSPKLLKGLRNIVKELNGNRQADTDEYLNSIIKGMNWEIQILNGTLDYINEGEELISKESANSLFIEFSSVYAEKNDIKLANLIEEKLTPFFENLEQVAKEKSK